MDLNVKLQGLKYNFGKVHGYFCKILRCRRFLGFTDLFSIREIHRICRRDSRPGPPASAHRSTGFIKCWPLIQRYVSKIYHREGVSRLLISAIHHQLDGWGGWLRPGATRARTHGGVPRPKSGRYKPTPLKINLITEIWTDRKRNLETLPSTLLPFPK
jgi:hypothetical protein